jgi:hypothetical protein
MAMGITLLVGAISVGSVMVLFLFMAGQQVQIKIHNDSIAANKSKLNAVSGLTDALTASQHLNSLPGLYSQRVSFTKFFAAYTDVNPVDTTLNSLTVDSSNSLQINGVSKTYGAIAKLARALADANVTVGTGANAANTPYFSSVSIANATTLAGRGVQFSITATVSPEVLGGSK